MTEEWRRHPVQKDKILKVQMVEAPDAIVLMFSNIAVTSIDGRKLQEMLDPLIEQIRRTEESNYKLFLDRFGLADDENTRRGYRALGVTYIWDVELSVRLHNALETLRREPDLLSHCLHTTKTELTSLKGVGDGSLTELERHVSNVSGLELRWK